MRNQENELADYTNKAADLAEAVRACILKDRVVDDATILALSRFVAAANTVADLISIIQENEIKFN